MNGDANVLPFLGSLRPTTWINGQRATWRRSVLPVS